MTLVTVILLANASATWFMCGVIWFVQVVHYPHFTYYSRGDFHAAMLDHQRRTGRVVFGPMIVELVTAVTLIAIFPESGIAWIGAALVCVWGLSTVLVQIPLHNRLTEHGFDAAVHGQLVRSNWIRTLAWSARACLCAWMVASN